MQRSSSTFRLHLLSSSSCLNHPAEHIDICDNEACIKDTVDVHSSRDSVNCSTVGIYSTINFIFVLP